MIESETLPENRSSHRDRIAFAIAIAFPVLFAIAMAFPMLFPNAIPLEVFGLLFNYIIWLVCVLVLPYIFCRLATREILIVLFALLTSITMMMPFEVMMAQKDKALGFRFLLTHTGLKGLMVFWGITLFLSVIAALVVYVQRYLGDRL
jgi:hypothetical protein